MALEKELETYHKELSNLLANEGKYVLIHGEEIVDVFVSYEDALKVGYHKFGLKPFMVKQIQAVEKIQYITRLLETPCHT